MDKNNNFYEYRNKVEEKKCEQLQEEIKESIFYDDNLILL